MRWQKLSGYNADAASAAGQKNLKSTLKPNMLGDAVVLNQDPWQGNPDEISAIGVEMTIAGGKTRPAAQRPVP